MDDLQVESYDEKEVATKKRSIKKRVMLGGALMLTLGLFGLSGCSGCDIGLVAGGAGSWYNSFLEDETEIPDETDSQDSTVENE